MTDTTIEGAGNAAAGNENATNGAATTAENTTAANLGQPKDTGVSTQSEAAKVDDASKTADGNTPAVDPKTIVPESAEGYTLPVPEGQDGAFAKTAAAWFHEAGIPPAQAEKLATKWNEFTAAQQEIATKAEADAEAQAEAKFKNEDSALRKEWGPTYDANIELGKRAFREFGFTEEIVDAVESKVGPAQLFKIFAKIGQGLGEDQALGLGNGGTLSFASAAEKLYGGGKG